MQGSGRGRKWALGVGVGILTTLGGNVPKAPTEWLVIGGCGTSFICFILWLRNTDWIRNSTRPLIQIIRTFVGATAAAVAVALFGMWAWPSRAPIISPETLAFTKGWKDQVFTVTIENPSPREVYTVAAFLTIQPDSVSPKEFTVDVPIAERIALSNDGRAVADIHGAWGHDSDGHPTIGVFFYRLGAGESRIFTIKKTSTADARIAMQKVTFSTDQKPLIQRGNTTYAPMVFESAWSMEGLFYFPMER